MNAVDFSYYETLCTGCMEPRGKQEDPCPHCGFYSVGYDAPPHQLKPGSILNGKYLVGRALGEGGFGITYIGFDLNLDLRVAIKEYYPNGLVTRQVSGTMSVTPFTAQGEQYDKGLNRFVQEAKSLAKFHDLTGIVSVKDFFRENSTAYIVMEYIEGETLKQYIARKGGRLSVEEALSILRPVIESLALVHSAGIIHRDISPDNIMLTKRGAKLIDFGAARIYVDEENRSRTVTLKSGYAPFEQYQTRGEQGPWTDVYALCATIYKCVTGMTPPEATDRMAEDVLKPLSALGAVIDPRQEAVLLKGLSVKAKDRYQDIPQLNAALFQTSVRSETVPIAPEPQPEPMPAPKPAPAKPETERPKRPGILPLNPQKRKWILAAMAACIGIPLLLVLIINMAASEKRGNTSINLNNGGWAAQQGDWIYFTEGAGGLYKEKINGTGRETLVASEDISHINVMGEWVYYEGIRGIWRIKTDGSGGKEQVETGTLARDSTFYIVDGWMYYQLSDNTIWRMPTDFSSPSQELFSEADDNQLVAIENGWIYLAGESALMKLDLGGRDQSVLLSDSFNHAQIVDDSIYYSNNVGLYRMDTRDFDKTFVLGGVTNSFQINGDWIYYDSVSNNASGIFRSHLNGSERTQLTDHEASDPCIAGDWVFYRGVDKHVYRVKKDGTQVTSGAASIAAALPATSPVAMPGVVNTRGNTSINLNNGGHVAQQGDWLYFTEGNDGLYKERLDGTDRETLIDSGWVQYINVVGDWVYYLQQSGVSRIKTDGSGQEFLFENPAYPWQLQLHVVDDVFYYMVDLEEGSAIYRQPIGGSPQILYAINEENTFVDIEAVEGGWIYFYVFEDVTTLMKMTLEGKEITPLARGNGLIYAQVIGDAIYYFENSDTYSPVYRIDTDGSNKTQVLDAVYESFQIHDGWIYYTHYNNDEDASYKREGRLYKARLDGSERTQLTDHDANDPCIAGDWIFYGTYLNGNVHRIKTDGAQDTFFADLLARNGAALLQERAANERTLDNWHESVYKMSAIRTESGDFTAIEQNAYVEPENFVNFTLKKIIETAAEPVDGYKLVGVWLQITKSKAHEGSLWFDDYNFMLIPDVWKNDSDLFPLAVSGQDMELESFPAQVKEGENIDYFLYFNVPVEATNYTFFETNFYNGEKVGAPYVYQTVVRYIPGR